MGFLQTILKNFNYFYFDYIIVFTIKKKKKTNYKKK